MNCFLLKTHFPPLVAPGPPSRAFPVFRGMAGLVEITRPSCVLSFSRLSRLLCFKRNIFPFKIAWNPELWGGSSRRRQPPWAAPLPPTSVPLGSWKAAFQEHLNGNGGRSGRRCSEVRNGERAASEPAPELCCLLRTAATVTRQPAAGSVVPGHQLLEWTPAPQPTAPFPPSTLRPSTLKLRLLF